MFNLSINNYRSFVNQEFKFSKFNILIGENSSGKSSLLKFFLMLQQTLKDGTEILKLTKPYVDLGNYKDIVYYNNEDLNISFSFEFDDSKYKDFYYSYFSGALPLNERPKYINNFKQKFKSPKGNTKLYFEINNKLNISNELKIKISNPNLGELTIQTLIRNEDTSIMDKKNECIFSYKRLNNNLVIDNLKIPYIKEGFLALIDSQKLIDECKKIEPELSIFYEIAWLLLTQNHLQNEISTFTYVNPIDTHPKRFYYEREPQPQRVIFTLDDFMSILTSSKTNSSVQDGFLNTLNGILQDYGIANKIVINKNDDLRVAEIKIQIKDLLSNVLEVGYGVSLQLPILFKILLSENQSILIEQPEVHLHPSLQAKFIHTLVKYGNAKSYFIETHSEYIVRKLQVLVKDKFNGLTKDDVTVHYFVRDDKKFTVTNHTIDEDGRLKPQFPSGFFDNSYNITSNLLKS